MNCLGEIENREEVFCKECEEDIMADESPIYEYTPERNYEEEVTELYTPGIMQMYQMVEEYRRETEMKEIDKEYEEWVKLEEKIKRKRRKIKGLMLKSRRKRENIKRRENRLKEMDYY